MANLMVTGATGFIGQWLCAELTANGHEVFALIRRPEQLQSLQRTCAKRGGNGDSVHAVIGDLDLPGLGLTRLPDVDIIFHLGARFAWNLSADEARATNVEGSLAVAGLASQIGARLVVVGGFMSQNPVHLNELGIDPLDPLAADWPRIYARSGSYEASKLQSFFATTERADRLGVPWIGVHPAALCGHSKTGEIAAGQPFVDLIETIAGGHLAAIPGGPDHWLPLVTVDHLARLLGALADRPWPTGMVLIALDPLTPDLASLVQHIAAELGVKTSRRRISLGLLRTVLRLPGVERFAHTSRESLSFIRTERLDVGPTEDFARAAGVRMPPIGDAVARTVDRIRQGNGVGPERVL